MSTSTLAPHGLRINNPGQIERISIERKDNSLFNKKGSLQRITKDLESSIIATSISDNKAVQIENILYSREPFIDERNSILKNPFKYYNPFYRHKLKKIDAKLDELDLQLYILESESKEIELGLDQAIKSAQDQLNKTLEISKTIGFLKK
jgi:hypothetical protein